MRRRTGEVALGRAKDTNMNKVSAKVPLWVKALQLTDRLAWYAYRAEEITRDELLRAWLRPELRSAVTARAYAKQSAYLPGGCTYEQGLFDWEDTALSAPPFPERGRVLLGAAGGGRELRVLCERGFEVVAFEPNDTLRAGAEDVAARFPTKAEVLAGTYDDLTAAADEGSGPLAKALSGGPFDAVILGWGSFTHVFSRGEQVALLRAVRRVAPSGPVLVSFFLRPSSVPRGMSDRLREGLRAVFSTLGANTEASAQGLYYEMHGGFVYYFTEEEIHALAFEAGYEVTSLRSSPFPHATLVPLEKS